MTALTLDDSQLRAYLTNFMITKNLQKFSHSNGTLLDHLLRTYDIAKAENGNQRICLVAGLHSIYGTTIYKNQAVVQNDSRVIKLFGEDINRLILLFGCTPRDKIHTPDGSIPDDDLYVLRWVEYANLKDQNGLDRVPDLVAFIANDKIRLGIQ